MNRVINLKVLENLRTKEELIEYFKAQGIEITDEELKNLKQQYSREKLNEGTLTMKQLDNVAGGLLMIIKQECNVKGKIFDPIQFAKDCNDAMGNIAYAFTFSYLETKHVCVLVNDGREGTRVTDVGTRKLEIENGNSLVFQNEYSESLLQQGNQPVSHEYKILSKCDNSSVFNNIILHSTSVHDDGFVESPLLIHDGTKLTIGPDTKGYYKSVFKAYEKSFKVNGDNHDSRNFEGLQVFENSLGVQRQHHEIPRDDQANLGEQTPLVPHANKATDKPHKSNELSGRKVAFCVALGLVVAAGLAAGIYYLMDKDK